MSKLIFEGAGWAGAKGYEEVGNCRIRTTFKNKRGQVIYLELTGTIPHKNSPQYVKNHSIYGWVTHCLVGGSGGVRQSIEGHGFEYNKRSILAIVNSLEIGGDFESIEINNDGYNGFYLNEIETKDTENV